MYPTLSRPCLLYTTQKLSQQRSKSAIDHRHGRWLCGATAEPNCAQHAKAVTAMVTHELADAFSGKDLQYFISSKRCSQNKTINPTNFYHRHKSTTNFLWTSITNYFLHKHSNFWYLKQFFLL